MLRDESSTQGITIGANPVAFFTFQGKIFIGDQFFFSIYIIPNLKPEYGDVCRGSQKMFVVLEILSPHFYVDYKFIRKSAPSTRLQSVLNSSSSSCWSNYIQCRRKFCYRKNSACPIGPDRLMSVTYPHSTMQPCV